VAYMGFLLGAVGGPTGTSITDPNHTLRRLFAREPIALEDLLATTADGKVRNG